MAGLRPARTCARTHAHTLQRRVDRAGTCLSFPHIVSVTPAFAPAPAYTTRSRTHHFTTHHFTTLAHLLPASPSEINTNDKAKLICVPLFRSSGRVARCSLDLRALLHSRARAKRMHIPLAQVEAGVPLVGPLPPEAREAAAKQECLPASCSCRCCQHHRRCSPLRRPCPCQGQIPNAGFARSWTRLTACKSTKQH